MPSPMSAGTIRQTTFGFLLLLGACSAQTQAQTTHTTPLYGPGRECPPKPCAQGDAGDMLLSTRPSLPSQTRGPQLLRRAQSRKTATAPTRCNLEMAPWKPCKRMMSSMAGRSSTTSRMACGVLVLLRGMAQRTVRNALIDEISATPLPIGVQQMATQLVRSNDLVLTALHESRDSHNDIARGRHGTWCAEGRGLD